jgi:hypothetical protein
VYAKEVEQDPRFGEAEKAARVYGEYGFVEGALVPALAGMDVVDPNEEHKIYVVDRVPGRIKTDSTSGGRVPEARTRPEVWRLIADPNKSYGAVLSLLDDDGNLFIVREHLEEGWPNRRHAGAFKKMVAEEVVGARIEYYADTGSAGAQSIVDLDDFGLPFIPVEKGAGSVSRTIKQLRGLAFVDPEHRHPITGKKGAPRIYLYAPGLISTWEESGIKITGCKLTEQISQARQRENSPPDTPDKDARNKLDLWDCLRYSAGLAVAYGEEERSEGAGGPTLENRIPHDSLTLSSPDQYVHPLDRPIELPTYMEEEWW